MERVYGRKQDKVETMPIATTAMYVGKLACLRPSNILRNIQAVSVFDRWRTCCHTKEQKRSEEG